MSNINEYQLEYRFISEELEVHGKYMVEAFRKAILDKKLVGKSNLLDSLNYRVDDSINQLSVSFLGYGRIHDLKSHNQSLKYGALETPDAKSLLWGIKPKTKRKKDRRWYAKTAYGSLGRVTNRLMYGFSEQERLRIKSQLESEKIQITEL